MSDAAAPALDPTTPAPPAPAAPVKRGRGRPRGSKTTTRPLAASRAPRPNPIRLKTTQPKPTDKPAPAPKQSDVDADPPAPAATVAPTVPPYRDPALLDAAEQTVGPIAKLAVDMLRERKGKGPAPESITMPLGRAVAATLMKRFPGAAEWQEEASLAGALLIALRAPSDGEAPAAGDPRTSVIYADHMKAQYDALIQIRQTLKEIVAGCTRAGITFDAPPAATGAPTNAPTAAPTAAPASAAAPRARPDDDDAF